MVLRVCSFPGCDRPFHANKLCVGHNAQRREGRELKTLLVKKGTGTANPKLYSVWNQMKQRCQNPNNEKYYLYGARGIEVRFASWESFYAWALAAGYREGLTIDRIDNDGHYEPSNCRWATPAEQVRNRRVTRTITAFGETKSVSEWAEDSRCSVTYDALIQRLRKSGWSSEDMITRPAMKNQFVPRHGEGGDAI